MTNKKEPAAEADVGCCGADQDGGERFGLSSGRLKSWGILLRAHSRATERIGRRVESEGGLPLDWYDVLLALEHSPQSRLRMGELAEHVTLSRSGLTRLIDRIEAAGLVERHLCPSDRRAFETVLTAQGREARAKSWPIYARALAEGFGSRYSEEEAILLGELLARQISEE